MGVIKRKSKTAKNGYLYEVNFTYKENGITRRHFKRGFSSKKEAELYEIKKRSEIMQGRSSKIKVHMTLNEVFDEFIRVGSAQYQENTLYNTKKDQRYFKDNLGVMYLDQIEYKDLQDFFNARINDGIETNKNIRKALNRVFVYAIRSGYIDNNPLQYVIVKGEDKTRKKQILSRTDLNRLLYKLAEKEDFKSRAYIVAILIGYYTGLRVSEVLALSKQDFLFSENLIRVEKKLIYKGLRKEDYYVTRQMKSKKSKGVIPLPSILRNYLKGWFDFNPYDKVVCDADGYYLNPTCLSNYVKKVAKTYEIKFNFHMLRHSFATELVNHRVDVKVAQELMRHENFNTTLSIYTFINDEQKKNAINDVFRIDCGDFVADDKKKKESLK